MWAASSGDGTSSPYRSPYSRIGAEHFGLLCTKIQIDQKMRTKTVHQALGEKIQAERRTWKNVDYMSPSGEGLQDLCCERRMCLYWPKEITIDFIYLKCQEINQDLGIMSGCAEGVERGVGFSRGRGRSKKSLWNQIWDVIPIDTCTKSHLIWGSI